MIVFIFLGGGQGGPFWSVPTGRRDGTVSIRTEALNNIPAPFANFSTLQTLFGNQGLDLKDLVLLSGKKLKSCLPMTITHLCFLVLDFLCNQIYKNFPKAILITQQREPIKNKYSLAL